MAYTLQPNKPSAKGLWKAKLPTEIDKIHIKAGSRIYASGQDGSIAALDISDSNGPVQTSWQTKVAGQVWNMLAADGKLFVVTIDGAIYCFGAEKIEPTYYDPQNKPFSPDTPKTQTGLDWIFQKTGISAVYHFLAGLLGAKPAAPDDYKSKLENILQDTDVHKGYCLLLGLESGKMLSELITQTELHIIILEPNIKKATSLRRRLDDAGLYGTRVAVLAGDITSIQLPPYMAHLIVSEDLADPTADPHI